MAEDAQDDRGRRGSRDSFKTTILTRLLTPIAAAGASAAAGYAVKKAPDMLERVLPKLRSLAGDAGNVTHDLPQRAASVASNAASSAGDVAQELGDRAKSLVSAAPLVGNGSSSGLTRAKVSPAELEKRREERARGRAERQKARRG
jgi:hypothetical protein